MHHVDPVLAYTGVENVVDGKIRAASGRSGSTVTGARVTTVTTLEQRPDPVEHRL
jgi:hypothetical protein